MTHIHSGVVCGADLPDVLLDTISPRNTVSVGIVTKWILCVVEPSSDFINTSASKCHSEPPHNSPTENFRSQMVSEGALSSY